MESISSKQNVGAASMEQENHVGQISGRTVRFPTNLTHTIEDAWCSHLEVLSCGHLVGVYGHTIFGGTYVTVWDSEHGFKELFYRQVYDQEMTAMRAHSNNRLAIGFDNGAVVRFKWGNGQLEEHSEIHFSTSEVCAIDTLPQRDRLVVGHDSGEVYVINAESQRVMSFNFNGCLDTLKVLSSQCIVMRSSDNIKIWNPTNGAASSHSNNRTKQLLSVAAIIALSPSSYAEIYGARHLESESGHIDTYSHLGKRDCSHILGGFFIRVADTLSKNVLVLSSANETVTFFNHQSGFQFPDSINLKGISRHLSIETIKVLNDGRLAVSAFTKIFIYSPQWK